jgi:phage shock protein A
LAEHRYVEDRVSDLEAELAEMKQRVEDLTRGNDVLARVLIAAAGGAKLETLVAEIQSTILGGG